VGLDIPLLCTEPGCPSSWSWVGN